MSLLNYDVYRGLSKKMVVLKILSKGAIITDSDGDLSIDVVKKSIKRDLDRIRTDFYIPMDLLEQSKCWVDFADFAKTMGDLLEQTEGWDSIPMSPLPPTSKIELFIKELAKNKKLGISFDSLGNIDKCIKQSFLILDHITEDISNNESQDPIKKTLGLLRIVETMEEIFMYTDTFYGVPNA